jgi:RNA polymerase sigma-70 factor (ECF subfamily)
MDANEDIHLSDVRTRWSQLLTPGDQVLRYYGPVYRYLLGVTRDPVAAKELANDFAVRFLAGKFSGATPDSGRLRDLIKTAVRNLAVDYWRRRTKEKRLLTIEESVLAEPYLQGADDRAAFDDAERDDFLARAWAALEREEVATGKPYYRALKLKIEQPTLRSEELARQMSHTLKRETSADAFRQTLHRARTLFADLLLDDVVRATECDAARLEDKLIELKLLEYCKSALRRRE